MASDDMGEFTTGVSATADGMGIGITIDSDGNPMSKAVLGMKSKTLPTGPIE